ncbi:uncharacterized protein JCM15063_002117 [Sporobolomyces koalae]|uniref:uncharacterized protein n=1 Tax=Sporobolomyces koalae TaxID=500713 RepID=UPI00317D9D51
MPPIATPPLTTASYPGPAPGRPPPTALPVGSSSDDSISTVATISSVDTLDLPYSPAFHPYSALVYTPPTRQKDEFIDDEGMLAKRFDGLGLEERAEAELAAKRYKEFASAVDPTPTSNNAASDPALAAFDFPRSPALHDTHTSGPARHTSLPAIVTSASHLAGLSVHSPVESSHSSTLSPRFPLYPTSSASLTGSAISMTPDVSPGQSPILSASPLVGSNLSEPSPYLPPLHQPFHQRSATTSSASAAIPPYSTTLGGGMARSGSTPSSIACGLRSPIVRSASSHNPPWALAASGAGHRPGSAGTCSTAGTSTSSRPWVFDSDASSVCSANSGGWSSGGGGASGRSSSQSGKTRERRVTEDGEEGEVDEGGEVFKAEGDVDFLDHRPEPKGAKLSIDRDDPSQVVLKVTLPGFSLDNITVAMRRGHKVHIVADSYGESGGHFEKLIHLGSDVSSVAPRAEFNGTDLNVYIQRRPSRPSSSASTAGGSTAALPPFGMTRATPGSPSSAFSSPDVDDYRRQSIASIASAWSTSSETGYSSSHRDSISTGHPLSPSLEYPSPTLADLERRRSEDIPPPFTVVAPPLNPFDAELRKSKSKSLTGPEGAKAAAKAAREEAARRAKEEAQKLPSSARGGRRLPFRRSKEDGTNSVSSGSAGESSTSEDGPSALAPPVPIVVKKELHQVPPKIPEDRAVSPAGSTIERNGTIKANSRSTSPLPSNCTAGSPTSISSSVSSSASSSVSSPFSSPPRSEPRPLPLFTNPSNAHHTHPRPKLREGNLTLRAPDGQTFASQAQSQWRNGFVSGSESEMDNEGETLTPRWEETGMRFHPQHSHSNSPNSHSSA